MAVPPLLQRLRIPVIGAPMFIAGNPKLVIEQCKAGIVGSFPALNARPKESLDQWLTEIEAAIASQPGAAPYAVNQICHKSNDRLEHDLEVCIRHKVPITITSLRGRRRPCRDPAPFALIGAVMPVAQVVENLAREYVAARQRLQIN